MENRNQDDFTKTLTGQETTFFKELTTDERIRILEKSVTKLWSVSAKAEHINRILKSVRNAVELLKQDKKEDALTELQSGCIDAEIIKWNPKILLHITSLSEEEMKQDTANFNAAVNSLHTQL